MGNSPLGDIIDSHFGVKLSPLALKLLDCNIPLPQDFHQRVIAVCTAHGFPQFAAPIIESIESFRQPNTNNPSAAQQPRKDTPGRLLSAIFRRTKKQVGERISAGLVTEAIVGKILIGIWVLHLEPPKRNEAIELGPELLKAFISDQTVYSDAITYYYEELVKLKGATF